MGAPLPPLTNLPDQQSLRTDTKDIAAIVINSYKRVNHEAAGKAAKWLRWFGERATVPAAVLSGVFKPSNLETAQRAGLAIFWSHRLQDLADYIEATR